MAVSAFTDATIKGLCQSVVVPTPIGDVTLKLTAGNGSKTVTAKNLYIDLDQLDADATFNNINIGVAAGEQRARARHQDRATRPTRTPSPRRPTRPT